jgi:hypothetical protein
MKTNLIMIWKRKDAPRKDTILGGKTETELTEATQSAGSPFMRVTLWITTAVHLDTRLR